MLWVYGESNLKEKIDSHLNDVKQHLWDMF